MNVIEYKCAECQSSAKMVDGMIVRNCEHSSGITADMSATTFGAGKVDNDNVAKKISEATKNVIEAIKNARG